MGKLSEQRRCIKCGNKSYTDFVGNLEVIVYSCRCGNVFSKIGIQGNLKLFQMMEDNPRAFTNLTVSDIIQILEEDAFKKENPLETYLCEREKTRTKEEISGLSATYQRIYWVINELEKEKGIVERKKLIEILRREYNIKSEIAEEGIEELLKIGGLYEPRDGFLKCTFSFDNKMKKD